MHIYKNVYMCVCVYVHICIYLHAHVTYFEQNMSRWSRASCSWFDPQNLLATGWRRPIGCLKLQVICRKRATNYRALLRKMTLKKITYFSCGKWPIIRHLMGLPLPVLNVLNRTTAKLTCKLTTLSRRSIILIEILTRQLATPPKNLPGTVVWTLILLSRLMFTTNSRLRRWARWKSKMRLSFMFTTNSKLKCALVSCLPLTRNSCLPLTRNCIYIYIYIYIYLMFTTNSKLRRIFDLYHPLDFSGWVRHERWGAGVEYHFQEI